MKRNQIMAEDLIELHLQYQMDIQLADVPKENNAMTTARRSEGKRRAKPGTKGEGDYYRIVLRAKNNFTTFRYQDVGEKGHIMRLAGQRSSGSWDTQAWLISKADAHMEGDTLVPDTDDAKKLIEGLGSKPKHGKGDVFEAKDRPNIPESAKPTGAQKRARLANIRKAQDAPRPREAKKE